MTGWFALIQLWPIGRLSCKRAIAGGQTDRVALIMEGIHPMNANARQHRALLQDIAHRAMQERGLLPDFSY